LRKRCGGDIVGAPGVECIKNAVPRLIEKEGLDLVVANAENAVGGSGLTPAVYKRLRQAGVDVITLGDYLPELASAASIKLIAGTVNGMFDFSYRANQRRLFLDNNSGEPIFGRY